MIHPTPFKRALFFIIADIILSLGTLFLAYNLRFNFSVDMSYMSNFLAVFVSLALLKVLFIARFGIYRVTWRYFSLYEAKKLIYAHLLAYIGFVLLYYLTPQSFTPFPRSVLMIDLFLSILFLGFFRFLKRLVIESDTDKNLAKTLIIGANSFAQSIIKERSAYNVSAVVESDKTLVGTHFSDLTVQDMSRLGGLIEKHGIAKVIIAKEYEPSELGRIFDVLQAYKELEVQIATLQNHKKVLKELSIEDLLARKPKDLDKVAIEAFIKNRVVLISGAGGSIGSEIARQCEIYGAAKLILVENSEFNLYTVDQQLGNIERELVMSSVLDGSAMRRTMQLHMPNIIIHAAAYKHVPLVEANMHEGLRNNILGTKVLLDLAIEYGVEKFVLISSDKAVRPTNVMGASKRICELYGQNVESSKTEVVSVRFGNVLGSSGSVIPKFQAQIARGENLSVTHPEVTRYFMLLSEACELVLQAASIGKGGEIFILDMGEPIKIADLARKMIALSGRDDIDIDFTGLRPGEKLYEELLVGDVESATKYESITVAKSTPYDIEKLNRDIEELLACENPLEKLQVIVPEFHHQTNR